jgi:small-conductance mechanosensitive channel
LALLVEATRGIPGILEEPEPKAMVRGFGAGSIDLSVEFWTDDFEAWMTVRSAAAVKINRAIKEAGVKMPEPPS